MTDEEYQQFQEYRRRAPAQPPITERQSDPHPQTKRRPQGKQHQWDIGVAPLERERLDTIAPLVRILGGVLFLAWSWVSTTLIIGVLLQPIIHSGYAGIGYSYLIGFVVSILVTVGEWVTEGEYLLIHWTIILLLDASFTTFQTHEWVTVIVKARGVPITQNLDIGCWVASVIGGIIAAKFGEKLLLRSRRTRYGSAVRSA